MLVQQKMLKRREQPLRATLFGPGPRHVLQARFDFEAALLVAGRELKFGDLITLICVTTISEEMAV